MGLRLWLKKKVTPEPFIRVFTLMELPELLALDQTCFGSEVVSRYDLAKFVMEKRSIVLVADYGFEESFVGYMLVVEHRSFIQIVRLGVHPEWRGCCIGSRLVDRVIARMNSERRRRCVAFVPESLLGAQKFFKACGFLCTRIVNGGGESGSFYQFDRKVHPNLATPYIRRH
jgi:ribosomal protein S18 acetylase RimI-like enzyme